MCLSSLDRKYTRNASSCHKRLLHQVWLDPYACVPDFATSLHASLDMKNWSLGLNFYAESSFASEFRVHDYCSGIKMYLVEFAAIGLFSEITLVQDSQNAHHILNMAVFPTCRYTIVRCATLAMFCQSLIECFTIEIRQYLFSGLDSYPHLVATSQVDTLYAGRDAEFPPVLIAANEVIISLDFASFLKSRLHSYFGDLPRLLQGPKCFTNTKQSNSTATVNIFTKTDLIWYSSLSIALKAYLAQ